MWSPVQITTAPKSGDDGESVIASRCSPTARCKHAMCSTKKGRIYLMGGRSGNLPLKDLWRFDPVENQWEEIKSKGHHPPNLQEHTMVEWNNKLYVFGGEIGVSSSSSTPLWILDLGTYTWKKFASSPLSLRPGSSAVEPSGRRGHTAVVYADGMHIYGGYQDLKGSTSELWTFDLNYEEWHLLSCSGRSSEQPSPRHSHSAIVHDNALWIYGGMTDLQEKNDFWKWDFGTRQWTRIKSKVNPGGLHSHTAIKAFGSMFIFGGERGASMLHELWRFHFATETWEKVQTEGMLPNPRCRHTAVANPCLEPSTWDQEECNNENRVLRIHSKSNCVSTEHPNASKALMGFTQRSISMCFTQQADGTAKTLKYLRNKVHPMSLNLCSRGVVTVSDDEDGQIEDVNGNGDGNTYSNQYNQNSAQVNLRKSLKEKITQSRLVRSISTSSYNILHNQNALPSEALKDELERLVEETTPQMSRPNAFRILNSNKIGPKQDSYRRMVSRNKMQKSQSSDAVLESESESSTPQHCSKPRPRSEVIQGIAAEPLIEDTNSEEWESRKMKRATVHESMSYYSLCFPSPPMEGKAANNSVSVGGSPSTPNENSINNNITSSSRPQSQHRLSSGHESHFVSALHDFQEEDDDDDDDDDEDEDEEEENENISNLVSRRVNKVNTALIDLDDNCNGIISSPTDGRPKSSGYNSLVTLYTPGIESRGIPHSVSHSSGYHSFADESMYDQKDILLALNPAPSRKGRLQREISAGIELKTLGSRGSDVKTHGANVAENGVQMRLNKENRARSLDRGNNKPINNQTRISSADKVREHLDSLKEVIVPNSPATRKWAYSPAKSKMYQHHWQLCMFVFGGREQGVSSIYKQPISIWKLYV